MSEVNTRTASDLSIGLPILFGLLSLGAALWMYLVAPDAIAGWGFAIALLAAGFSILTAHL